jgi:hypothetical protein
LEAGARLDIYTPFQQRDRPSRGTLAALAALLSERVITSNGRPVLVITEMLDPALTQAFMKTARKVFPGKSSLLHDEFQQVADIMSVNFLKGTLRDLQPYINLGLLRARLVRYVESQRPGQ